MTKHAAIRRRRLSRLNNLEALESRWLLAGVPVPSSIDPSFVSQALFTPDSAERLILQNSVPATAGGALYRFAVDSPEYSGVARFDIKPAEFIPVSDAALALFDASGNLIASADADPDPAEPGREFLSAELVSGEIYVLGAYFLPQGPPGDYLLTVEPGAQVANTPLAIDPSSGTLTFIANSGEDALTGPRDVDYYPLDLTNGGATGTVTVTPLGLDGKIFASVFRRANDNEPWRLVDSAGDASGGPVQLSLSPDAGRSLTDAEFMLSVATENFDGGPGGYQIHVAAIADLAPATITPGQAADLHTLSPISPGQSEARVTDTVAVGESKLYRFRTTEEGVVGLTVGSPAETIVSVYDQSGALLDVFTARASFPLIQEISALAGTDYHVRIAPMPGQSGGFSLVLRAAYTPSAVDISGGPATVNTPVGSAVTGVSYRVAAMPEDDVLVVQVDTDVPAAFDVVVVGAGDGNANPFQVSTSVVAGAPLVLPIDVSHEAAPLDVFIQGTSAAATATIQLGAIDIPTTIIQGTVMDESVGTDDQWGFNRNTSGFGQMTGAQFVELQRDKTQPTPLGATLTADGMTGARLPGGPVPILAHYRQVGSTLRLQSFEIADENNQAQVHYAGNLTPQMMHAVVGFNASFAGAGPVAYGFEGEQPLFVGIQMVPDQEDPLPPPDRMVFAARNVQLSTELDRDLWKTILPFNILDAGSYPLLNFKPSESTMQIRVTTLLDPHGPEFASKIMTQQDSTWVLDAVPPGNDAFFFKNKKLHFVVEPVAGHLGNGIYTLDMKVNTTDPRPHLVEEPAFKFFGTNPAGTPADTVELPDEPIVDIVQDPTGFGYATGTFTSSTPHGNHQSSPGAIDVYRFWANTPGPVTVKTIGLPDGSGEVNINTNFRLYREYLGNGNSVAYLDGFGGAVDNGLGDWFPADRDVVDDQTYVNYFDAIGYTENTPSSGNNFYLTGGGAYYVVVKNEQGTLGDYRIEVDTAPFPLLGDAATYDLARHGDVVQLPWNNGTSTQATFSLPYVQGVRRFVGYVPLQLPEFHNGTLQIVGQANSAWNLNLYDESFAMLHGTVNPTVGSPSHTEATFNVPDGTQQVYLRVHEYGENPNAWATLTASIGLVQPFGIQAPAAALSSSPAVRILPTTPAGDSPVVDGVPQPFTDAFTSGNQTSRYGFQSQGGYVSVKVAPERDAQGVADVELVWAAYVNGQRMTWNHTLNSLPTGESEVQFFLPDIRGPLHPTDYAYDRGPYYDVVIHVQTLSSPIHGGDFSITVATSSDRPMRNADLVLPPLAQFSTIARTADANDWTHFFVPQGASAVTMHVIRSAGFDTGFVYSYDLYDHDGQFVSSGLASSLTGTGVTFTLSTVQAGHGYFVRTGHVADVTVPVVATLSATMSKNSAALNRPPASVPALNDPYDQAAAYPSGIKTFTVNASSPHRVFWVGAPGQATFTTDVGTLASHYLALYRLSVSCGEACSNSENLVDFANATSFANGVYTFTTYVEPGAYELRVVQFGEMGSGMLTITLPQYVTDAVVLEPNSGSNSVRAMQGVVEARDGFGQRTILYEKSPAFGSQIHTGFRTSMFQVEAPPGALGDLDVYVEDLNGNPLGTTQGYFLQESNAVNQAYFQTPLTPDSPSLLHRYVTDAQPGESYWTGTFRMTNPLPASGLLSSNSVYFDFLTPESGKPDLVIEPLVLSPNSGQTLVGITIRNVGYGSAPLTHSLYSLTDKSHGNPTTTDHIILEHALGPRTSRPRNLAWTPNSINDRARYEADYDMRVEELKENNNVAEDWIGHIDPGAPSLAFSVNNWIDGDGNSSNGFGRYITKVPGVETDVTIQVSHPGGTGFLYNVTGWMPQQNQQFPSPMGLPFQMGNQSQLVLNDFDFGTLLPTNSNNPNRFDLLARDIYGVPSQNLVREVHVKEFPGWLLPEGSDAITFNPNTKKYDIHFRNQLINIGPTTLSDLLGVSIPFVGGLENRLLLEMGADATASLDPAVPVNATTYARAQIKVLGDEIFNTTYQLGLQTPSNYVSISGTIDVNSVTLDADYLDVTFAMAELPLFSFASPKIPLFAFGVPEVASIQASLQFSFQASLESKVTLAMDLATPPSQPARVGFASPTYIAANLDAGLSISGDVTFLGMDLASLVGTIHLVVSPAYGLDSPTGQFVPFNQFTNNDCTEVTGYMYGEIGAEILGLEVYSFDLPSVQIPIPNSCNVVGHRPGDLGAVVTIPGGDDPVGSIILQASPELVIDPQSQDVLYLQLVDVDSAAGVRQNLAWARRRGVWSALTTISDADRHLSNPVLTATHDGTGVRSVAVYNSLLSPGDPAQLTRNQFFSGQDLRYRYFDGVSWSSEQSLTADSLYDFDHALAFNSSGKGAVAWVKNGNAAPLDPQGRFDRSANEIQVAIWDPIRKVFGSQQALTVNSVGDSQPAVYAHSNGKFYVVWIQDTGFDPVNHVVTGNRVMYSVYDPAVHTWSSPAELVISGLPAAGTISTVQIGSEGGDRIHVLVGHSQTDADMMVTSKLYDRASTAADFALAQPLAVVAENMNFTDLRVTNAPDGGLLAYWMAGNGQTAEVMGSRLDPPGSGSVHWSRPFALSSTDGNVFPMSPSLAVDTNGKYQVVYENRMAPTSTLPAVDPTFIFPLSEGHPDGDPQFDAPFGGGVGSSSYSVLPEFGFLQPFGFAQEHAVAGATADGTAIITNRGLIGDAVLVEYVRANATPPGTYTVLGTQTVYLAPGQSYAADFEYPVSNGTRTYGIRLTSSLGTEMIGLSDNVSTDDLTGKRDIAVTSIQLSNPNPVAGETVTVNVQVQNLSTVDVGAFRVELYDSNPTWQFHTVNLIGSAMVNQLQPQESKIRSFSWTVPAGGGRFPLFAAADLGHTLDEVTHGNNSRSQLVMVLPEVAVQSITANVLRFSGVDNVQIDTVVANLGNANAEDVTVSLYYSLDNGSFQFVDSLFFQAMAPGQVTPLSFVAPGLVGLTGENRYRVVATYADLDPTNQLQQTLLLLQGAADLLPTGAHLNVATPTQGEPATMIVDIHNVGIATAQQVLVEVYGTNPDNTRYLLGSQIIAQMDPLSVTNLEIPLNTWRIRGLVEFCVEVDGPQEILELTDLNNFACFRQNVADALPHDYGDALEVYPVTLEDDGARHRQAYDGAGSPLLSLGQLVDYELDGQPSSDGKGDDMTGAPDEDGVAFLDPLRQGSTARIRVTVGGSALGYLSAWFDFDANGSWQDAGEQIFTDLAVLPGVYDFTILVPSAAATGVTYARFRLSTEAGLSEQGPAPDGEVEDYRLIVRRSHQSPVLVFAGDVVQRPSIPSDQPARSWADVDDAPQTITAADNVAESAAHDVFPEPTRHSSIRKRQVMECPNSAATLDAWQERERTDWAESVDLVFFGSYG